jgi:hypothetical protein
MGLVTNAKRRNLISFSCERSGSEESSRETKDHGPGARRQIANTEEKERGAGKTKPRSDFVPRRVMGNTKQPLCKCLAAAWGQACGTIVALPVTESQSATLCGPRHPDCSDPR